MMPDCGSAKRVTIHLTGAQFFSIRPEHDCEHFMGMLNRGANEEQK
jgi:hypothetical protein